MSAAPNWDHFFEDDFPLLLLLILSSVVAAAVNLPNKCLLIRATGFLFVFQRFCLDSTQTVLKRTAKEISVLFIPLVFLLPFSSAVLSVLLDLLEFAFSLWPYRVSEFMRSGYAQQSDSGSDRDETKSYLWRACKRAIFSGKLIPFSFFLIRLSCYSPMCDTWQH